MKWKYGSTTWLPLKDYKESFTLGLTEYAKHNNTAHELAFA